MNRCEGSGKPAVNARKAQGLGSKFDGKTYGECSVCGRHVRCRVRTTLANPHQPKTVAE